MHKWISGFLSLLLISCSYLVEVKVSGNNQKVNFTIQDSTVRLYKINVSILDENMVPIRSVWETTGSRKLQHFSYGEKLRGFEDQVVAEPLKMEAIYMVDVSGSKSFGPIISLTCFSFDPQGSAIEVLCQRKL